MVTCSVRLAKAKVAGSNPVFRSIQGPDPPRLFALVGVVAFERFERVSPASVDVHLLLAPGCITEQLAASGC